MALETTELATLSRADFRRVFGLGLDVAPDDNCHSAAPPLYL